MPWLTQVALEVMTLPHQIVIAMNLKHKGREMATIADGQVIDCEKYIADLEWTRPLGNA